MEKENIFEFNQDSSFLIDLRLKNYKSLLSSINNSKNVVPNKEEILTLEGYISDLKNRIKEDDLLNQAEIKSEFYNALNEFIPGIHKLNNKYKTINEIIKNYPKREKLTLRKMIKLYKKKTGYNIGKTSLYYILTKKLKYKYLRTKVKTNRLNDFSSKIRSFIFIKIIIRAIYLKMKIIFLDESNFQIENNHLKVWRNKTELPLFNTYKRGRKNIILSIADNEILLFDFNDGTNKSSDFLDYMKKLISKIGEKELQKYLIIMDNCSIHHTKELRDFYTNNKLKILKIVPYASDFNSVEFVFNLIKQKVYKRVFGSFSKLIPFVKNILDDEDTKKSLINIYIKTMNIYLDFLNNNKHII